MYRAAFAVFAILLNAPFPVAANGYEAVSDKGHFMTLVDGRELRLGALGIRLQVKGDGSIEGTASGWDLTGSWSWQDGYFCREMDWSGYEISYNCQLVEVAGNRMRFTVDRGAGRSAEFNLR